MTPTVLFQDIRRWLGDEVVPYKWATAELVDYYNWTMDDLVRDTHYFDEASTEAIVHETLVAGTPDYAFDERILEIIEARIIGETINLTKYTYAELVALTHQWRFTESVTGTNLSFDATADTIASTDDEITDLSIFTAGEYIEVMGSTSNNETYLIESVTSELITVDDSFNPMPLTEVAGDQVVIKQLYTGTPMRFCTDYRQGYITLSPAPDEAGVLFLTCNRKQLTALTSATISTETIPINAQYHLGLIDGIISKAYLKSMPNTFNIEKSQSHANSWLGTKEKVKRDLIRLHSKNRTAKPHNGCL